MTPRSASLSLKLQRSRSDAMCSLLSVPVTTATPRCSDHLSTTCGMAWRVRRDLSRRSSTAGKAWALRGAGRPQSTSR
eukprot:scaffold27367_cov112-Isochrysis_galbana.AAC.4